MKEKLLHIWKVDPRYVVMGGLWLATLVASFFGSYLLPITLPGIGTIYLFRILLPITAVMYLVWAVPRKEPFWKGISALEKWCYVLCAILMLYGMTSLPRAIEFSWTFRRLYNLGYDLLFFLLLLRVFRDCTLRTLTMKICQIMLILLIVLGYYEVFFGGIVDSAYDDFQRIHIFNGIFQYPVVFSGNTNNYMASLIFLYAVILMWRFQSARILHTRGNVWTILVGVLIYGLTAGNAILCRAGLCILLAGVALCTLVHVGSKRWVLLLLAAGILFIEFSTRYYYLVPQVQQYLTAVQENHVQESADSNTAEETNPPTLVLTRPGQQSLAEQFFTTDEETGEKTLRTEGSAGVRARLLIHAGKCFIESRGLGVGLGNTEILARDREVVEDSAIWNIHCFIARLLADYGAFALVPLCVIAWLVLREIIRCIGRGFRCRDRNMIGRGILFFTVILLYPFVSTAPSDAQDLLPMWIYLGCAVVFARTLGEGKIMENL